MAIPRFFINQPHAHELLAPEAVFSLRSTTDAYRHITKVLRLAAGGQVEVVQRGIWTAWLCEIDSICTNQINLRVISEVESAALPFDTSLIVGFSKGDTVEKVTRQATELGVARIVPTLFARSISRPDKKRAGKRIERLRAIAISAAQQSHRSDLPQLEDMHSFSDLLGLLRTVQPDLILVPWKEEPSRTLSEAIAGAELSKHPHVAIVIGPEGGITAEEIEEIRELGAQSVSLGGTILRVDTAVCTALAIAHDALQARVKTAAE